MIKLAVGNPVVMYVLLLPDYMALQRDLDLTIVRDIVTHFGGLENSTPSCLKFSSHSYFLPNRYFIKDMKLFKTPTLYILCCRLLNSVGYTIVNVGNINQDEIIVIQTNYGTTLYALRSSPGSIYGPGPCCGVNSLSSASD